MSAVVLAGILVVSGAATGAQASPGASDPRSAPASSASLWRCWWSPTMDRNWHNDALCSNGVSQARPYLRPAGSFITRDELMSSARAWARARNSGR